MMETIRGRLQVGSCALAAIVAASAIAAQPAAVPPVVADAVRGGWVAEAQGVRHIFVLKVADGAVSGIYCAVDCSDPAHLAFVERGTLLPDGARFQVRQPDRGERATVIAREVNGALQLVVSRNGLRPALPSRLRLTRDPRKPATVSVEELFARRGVTSGPLVIAGSSTPYVPRGPDEMLTPAKIAGLWVWSDGPGRQHFIFKAADDRLLGMVCGPCDNPWTFGVLDRIVIDGTTLTFDINHEDWGIGIEYGPYANHATATLARHELHLRTTQQNGNRVIQGDLVLTGPIRTTSP